jgi:hypothetical protein
MTAWLLHRSEKNVLPVYTMYVMEERGGKYEIVNKDSGRRHGKTTKSKAAKQMRLLQAIEHGFIPRRR